MSLPDYKIVRSNRRTLALEIKKNGEIIVRSPKHTPLDTILKFVSDHEGWLLKNLQKVLERKANFSEPTEQEIVELKRKAKDILPKKVEFYSALTGLTCQGVKITSAKTRFGSCNGKNSICFSYHLMRYPEEAIDYVVLHELAHTKHHDHSKRFWGLVAQYMPDYKKRRELLKG